MATYLKPKKATGKVLGQKDENEPNFYAHRRYRNFRAKMKKMQRAKDEAFITGIYMESDNITLDNYMTFKQSDNPACVTCWEQGKLTPGRVLDHITPIERGGAKYDTGNLQWMCDLCHNKKRATEDKK
jgi:5-methylcytosine-specific restriction protein A